jgi:aspartokinase
MNVIGRQPRNWTVHKFGGTSVADTQKILAAARKARTRRIRKVVRVC